MGSSGGGALMTGVFVLLVFLFFVLAPMLFPRGAWAKGGGSTSSTNVSIPPEQWFEAIAREQLTQDAYNKALQGQNYWNMANQMMGMPAVDYSRPTPDSPTGPFEWTHDQHQGSSWGRDWQGKNVKGPAGVFYSQGQSGGSPQGSGLADNPYSTLDDLFGHYGANPSTTYFGIYNPWDPATMQQDINAWNKGHDINASIPRDTGNQQKLVAGSSDRSYGSTPTNRGNSGTAGGYSTSPAFQGGTSFVPNRPGQQPQVTGYNVKQNKVSPKFFGNSYQEASEGFNPVATPLYGSTDGQIGDYDRTRNARQSMGSSGGGGYSRASGSSGGTGLQNTGDAIQGMDYSAYTSPGYQQRLNKGLMQDFGEGLNRMDYSLSQAQSALGNQGSALGQASNLFNSAASSFNKGNQYAAQAANAANASQGWFDKAGNVGNSMGKVSDKIGQLGQSAEDVLLTGNLPDSYYQNWIKGNRRGFAETMGSSLNNLASKGVLNSSVTNKSLGEVNDRINESYARNFLNSMNSMQNSYNTASNIYANQLSGLQGQANAYRGAGEGYVGSSNALSGAGSVANSAGTGLIGAGQGQLGVASGWGNAFQNSLTNAQASMLPYQTRISGAQGMMGIGDKMNNDLRNLYAQWRGNRYQVPGDTVVSQGK